MKEVMKIAVFVFVWFAIVTLVLTKDPIFLSFLGLLPFMLKEKSTSLKTQKVRKKTNHKIFSKTGF